MVREDKPDTARSWAICLAACVINTMLSGISRTTGLFYVALIETYGVSRLQANMPFTMRNIVRNLTAPLVGAIGQRYGARDVSIAGGVCASLGIILCTFVPNINWITVLWGGMHGLGVALANTLFQVIVTQYFVKYRATAAGLALSGACIGSLVFPVFIEYALLHTGLSGTFLITGGLIMHVIPAAIMMKEPPWIRPQVKPSSKARNSITAYRKPSKLSIGQNMGMIKEESDGTTSQAKEISARSARRISSRSVMPTIHANEELYNNGKPRGNSGFDNAAFTGSKTDLTRTDSKNSKFYKDNKIDNQSPLNISGSKTDLTSKGIEQVPEIPRPKLRTISIGELSVTIPVGPNDPPQETSLYKGMIKVCRDPMFHLISLSLAAFAMLFDPAITVIVDYLMDKGVGEDIAKYFISMLALGDLIGRLCFGWVTDKNYMSIPKFVMLLQLIQGICFVLMPFFNNFDVLMTLMIIYGLASGANLVIIPILVTKYLQTVQSLAIGSIQFFSGILSFAVPPLIGYFRDQVGSYDGMFYITGGMSIIVGLMWLLEPILLKLKSKLEGEQSPQSILSPS